MTYISLAVAALIVLLDIAGQLAGSTGGLLHSSQQLVQGLLNPWTKCGEFMRIPEERTANSW